MKKLFPVIVIALLATLVIGCSKKKDETPSLVGKWKISSYKYHEVDASPSKDTTDNYTGDANDYMDFRNDGKFYMYLDAGHGGGGIDSGTYTIIGTKVTMTNTGTFNSSANVPTNITLQSLTSSSATLYQRKDFNTVFFVYNESTYTLSK